MRRSWQVLGWKWGLRIWVLTIDNGDAVGNFIGCLPLSSINHKKMKQFFKFMFASALGLVLGIFLLFIILGGIGAMLGSKGEVKVEENSVLHIKLDNEIKERGIDKPFDIDPSTFKPKTSLGLNEILASIEKAATDDRIKGIYLDMQGLPTGMASTEEIRNALLKFKESGKWIVSYSEMYSQKAYYVASVADQIWLNPEGLVEWRGLGSQVVFLKNMFEKLELEPQIIRYGKFKSAVEPLMLDKMSEANRLQTMTYMDALWDQMLEGVAASRGKTAADLDSMAQQATIRKAEHAVEHGLVDALKYKDEVLADLRSRLSIEKEDGKINFIAIGEYKGAAKPKEDAKSGRDRVAVIYAVGGIDTGEGDDESIGSETISNEIRKARLDDKVKAIVLRINSGGGSALASDVIWRETVLAKEAKPFVVSFGDVAASGGYYIACAADTIVAQPNTITGSIGVFGVLFNAQKMLQNKFGITVDTVKTNRFADLGGPLRPLSEVEREIIQESVNDIYFDFIGKVAQGRGLTTAEVDSIGQGRVWSGKDALRIGLVDVLGGLNDAVAIAAKMAGLEDYRVTELPEQKDAMEQIIKDLTGGGEEALLKARLGNYYTYMRDVESMMNMRGVQARMPYTIYID
jgi:protease IV